MGYLKTKNDKKNMTNVVKNESIKDILRSKIEEKKINRCSKKTKEAILENNLKKIGIDKNKLKEDLEAVKKQGGLEINIKN
jgi:hypothetical protein